METVWPYTFLRVQQTPERLLKTTIIEKYYSKPPTGLLEDPLEGIKTK